MSLEFCPVFVAGQISRNPFVYRLLRLFFMPFLVRVLYGNAFNTGTPLFTGVPDDLDIRF